MAALGVVEKVAIITIQIVINTVKKHNKVKNDSKHTQTIKCN